MDELGIGKHPTYLIVELFADKERLVGSSA